MTLGCKSWTWVKINFGNSMGHQQKSLEYNYQPVWKTKGIGLVAKIFPSIHLNYIGSSFYFAFLFSKRRQKGSLWLWGWSISPITHHWRDLNENSAKPLPFCRSTCAPGGTTKDFSCTSELCSWSAWLMEIVRCERLCQFQMLLFLGCFAWQ